MNKSEGEIEITEEMLKLAASQIEPYLDSSFDEAMTVARIAAIAFEHSFKASIADDSRSERLVGIAG